MEKQKYDNGQFLYFIDFPGYAVYEAVNKVYEPSTRLYRINYKVPGSDLLMMGDVPETSLITLGELMQGANSVNTDLPEGFKEHSVGTLIFTDGLKFFVGTLNFDGKWKDYNSDEFIEVVTHWLYRDGFPDIEFGNARFYDEGELPDEPV